MKVAWSWLILRDPDDGAVLVGLRIDGHSVVMDPADAARLLDELQVGYRVMRSDLARILAADEPERAR